MNPRHHEDWCQREDIHLPTHGIDFCKGLVDQMDKKTLIISQIIMTFLMAFVMSGILSALMLGFSMEWFHIWMRQWFIAWPIAFIATQFVSRVAFPLGGMIAKRF